MSLVSHRPFFDLFSPLEYATYPSLLHITIRYPDCAFWSGPEPHSLTSRIDEMTKGSSCSLQELRQAIVDAPFAKGKRASPTFSPSSDVQLYVISSIRKEKAKNTKNAKNAEKPMNASSGSSRLQSIVTERSGGAAQGPAIFRTAC